MPVTQRGSVLVAGDAADSDYFGDAAALSSDGSVLAVGAHYRADSSANSGGVYIYDRDGSAWTQRGSAIVPDASSFNARFGAGVALSDDGTILVVGASEYYIEIPESYGAVLTYDYAGGVWTRRSYILAPSATDVNFGSVVAVSGDGAVMAVNGIAGSVAIYDWTAGSWVQRGSEIAMPTDRCAGTFPTALALSSDGTILAASGEADDISLGSNQHEGSVWIYDWNSGAASWDQRGTKINASDPALNDYFGASVALNGAGTTLAVGALRWENTPPPYDQGQVYLLDYAGGVWTERTTVAAADPASYDYFGAAVALSADGATLAVGASQWEDAINDQGGVYTYDVVAGEFATAYTTLTVTLSSGTAVSATELTVISKAYASTALTVVDPSGVATAPAALTVTATGSASAPTLLAMIAPAPAVPAVAGVPGVVWSARCLIDGVDVSARLVGQASVTAAEGAARIASITLRPPAGIIEPLDYVGKSITLDYVLVIGTTAVPRRLFTGRVDTPAYDPDSTLLTLTCTDDLQNVVASLPVSAINHMVGGLFSEAVQGELDDNWDYAQARLTTVAGSLDASASGGLRTTLWESGSIWATFTESDLIYQRMQLTLPQRSTLINKVEIGFDYRFMRLHQRQTTVGWSGTQPEMAKNGYQYPTQQDILGAAEGTGWTVTQGIFYSAPTAIPVEIPVGSSLLSGFFYPPAGSIDMAVLHLARRHSQTVTERYTITVTAGESVAVNGELPSALRGALASSFSGGEWESALDVVPLMPEGGVQDYAPDADRDDADYAIQTLLDQARVKILSSHRSGRVGNAILCNPDLDLDKRVAIDTAQVSAAGKVALLVHVLDFESGSATTEFSLAISGVGGDGSSTPDVLAPPPPRMFVDHSLDWVYEIPPLSCHTYGVTPYDEGLMGLLLNPTEGILVEDIPYYGSINAANPFYVAGSYPVTGFRMQMPGVDDADRNPIDDPVAASYSIIVPTDTLTFTVP